MKTEEFRSYICKLNLPDITITQESDRHFVLTNKNATGEIVIHDQDIIELMIKEEGREDYSFYLHFQLGDAAHAEHLLSEMVGTMRRQKDRRLVRVLLTCTSALTTSYFVMQLNEAAASAKINYRFEAVSFDQLYDVGFAYDMILLAPQVHYQAERVREIFNRKPVLVIPASIFGTYNTGALIEYLISERSNFMEAVKDDQQTAIRSIFNNDLRILCVDLINHHNKNRIAYRIYDHGRPTLDKEVIKETIAMQDIYDLLDYVFVRHENIDAVGLAVPGVTYHGHLYHPEFGMANEHVGKMLGRKYRVPVIMINDVNAMALGYYALNENCPDMVFHFQPLGGILPGAGIILNDHLYTGRLHAAGEIGRILKSQGEATDGPVTPEAAMKTLAKAVIMYIWLLAPERIVIYSELTPNMDELREYVATMAEREYIPELVHVGSLKNYMLAGTMVHVLEILSSYGREGKLAELTQD